MHRAALPLAALLAAPASAAIIVTDLDPGSADFSAAGLSAGSGSAVRANGHTVNLQFTPTAGDLAGTTVLFEYGGTSNGFSVILVDGVLTYTTKHNSSDQWTPDSLNDTSLRPDTATRGEAAVQSTFGALAAETGYSAAVSWDQAGTLFLGVQDDSAGQLDSYTLTGFYDNWSGNNSIAAGQISNSAGGLASELAASPDAGVFDASIVKPFSGTLAQTHYWNDAGTIAVIPEPSAGLLAAAGLLGLLRRRR